MKTIPTFSVSTPDGVRQFQPTPNRWEWNLAVFGRTQALSESKKEIKLALALEGVKVNLSDISLIK